MRRFVFLALISIIGLGSQATPAPAQLMDILTAPKTLIDYAIEARSMDDIAEDNRIVIDVNAIMVDLGTIKASTEIYEQRLLITGLFDDKKLYDQFYKDVKKITGIKKLYWHVRYLPKAEQERRYKKKKLLDWGDALKLDIKVGLSLISTGDVADVNFRVAVDAFGNVYLMGRARSKSEMAEALKATRKTEGVSKIINYAIVKP